MLYKTIASIVVSSGQVVKFEHTPNSTYKSVTFLNGSPGAAEASVVVGEQVAGVRLASAAGFGAHTPSAGQLSRGLQELAIVSKPVNVGPGMRVSGTIRNNSTKAAHFTIFLQ